MIRYIRFAHCTFLFFILVSSTLFGQNGLELPDERTAYSKTYLKADGGREQVIAAGPVHYFQDGSWQEIETAFEENSLYFSNSKNALRTVFPKTHTNGSFIEYASDQGMMSASLSKKLVRYDNATGFVEMNLSSATVTGQVNDGLLIYENIYPGMSDEYELLNGAVKNALRLDALHTSLTNESAAYFGFSEELILPEGWSIRPLTAQVSELIQTSLLVVNGSDEVVFQFPAPVFFDNGNANNDGATLVEGAYHVDLSGGVWTLTTLVPLDWLQDPARSYPVYLDPTVVLAGINGGWQSQNNAIDNSAFVFIGVCCGNLEHRAWVLWNTTSIPDASCVTNVEMQIYVNGVGAATAELVHAYDITGQFGPYGGIVPAAYADMATGWYTSFTLTGVGTYGYYDLGANADALLQSQLPGNLYEVAMIFDYEPSTNWKRLTATSCNLRVTYNDPPCVVLPVGLSSFDIVCDNDQSSVQWSTASEVNNAFFTLSTSEDGINFVEAGRVDGAGTSSSSQHYRFLIPPNDPARYCRLSQTDLDGTTTILGSKVIPVCESNAASVHVNAFADLEFSAKDWTSVEVLGESGRSLLEVLNAAGLNTLAVDNPGLSPGIYTALFTLNSGAKEVVRFVMP